jgi:hypothetical protein
MQLSDLNRCPEKLVEVETHELRGIVEELLRPSYATCIVSSDVFFIYDQIC